MKLAENKIEVDGSDSFTEESFSVGNAGLIFDILRNKLYSNAIESICREYSSNARDAHREIGTFDRPIEIHFPNAFDGNFRIKDYGIGISKSRMSDVFIKYGNSTKRNDNIQLGAFGVGAKSAWSYTNQFSIKTTANENNVNTTCIYMVYLDESNAGKMRLVKEEITDLPTGTEIIIPVEDKDIQSFIDGIIKSTQYWKTRPLFFGIEPLPAYTETVGSLLAEGSDGSWKIYNTKSYNTYYRTNAQSLAIIDGIQYELNESFISSEDRWILACNVHLFFNIGELTLSASRETLQYDQNTINLLNSRIKSLQKELSEQIVDIINSKPSYIEAVEFYTYISNYFYKCVNNKGLTWNGYKIVGHEVPIYKYILNEMKAGIKNYTKSKNYNGKISIRSSEDFKIHLNKKVDIYYNDIDPEHSYRNKNLKALESASEIQIINYIKGKSYDDFVIDIKAAFTKYFAGKLNYSGDIDNSFIFDLIEPKLLSSIVENKIVLGKRIHKAQIIKPIEHLKVYKYNHSCGYKLKNYFFASSIAPDHEEGCYVETVFKTDTIKTSSKIGTTEFSYLDLKEIKKLINIPIISVKEKDIPKLTKLRPLLDVLQEKFNELVNSDYYKSIALNHVLNDYNSDHYEAFSHINNLRDLVPFKNKILNTNSLILKYFEYLDYFNGDISFIKKLEVLFNKKSNIDNYIEEVGDLLGEIKNRYELLNCIYNITDHEKVIDYINMCDNYNQKTLKLVKGI